MCAGAVELAEEEAVVPVGLLERPLSRRMREELCGTRSDCEKACEKGLLGGLYSVQFERFLERFLSAFISTYYKFYRIN